MAVLPTYRGLHFDLGQIPFMDLAPRAACHALALGEGGEGCMGGWGGPLVSVMLVPSQPAPPEGHGAGGGTDSAVPLCCWRGWRGQEGLSLCWWHGGAGLQ